MQLQAITQDVQTHGVTSTRAFSIENDAAMFSILADKIYSDKPKAVVREICCNALDIHNQIGQSRPFRISLPTDDGVGEPMLVVRDFGTGLDDAGMSTFTTFGKSTKRATNGAVGGFGIGCKSPFAYTNAFTVASYQGGVVSTYCAFRGPDGVPQLTDAEVAPTSEPDGLEIRVPIKQSDFYKFRGIAETILADFPEGSFEPFGFDVEPVGYSSRNDLYAVRAKSFSYGKAKVLIGPVAYDLDWSQVVGVDMPPAIVPIFGIGELSLAPSRESLSYDPVTVQRLKDRFSVISAGIYADMKTEIDALPIWRKLQFIRHMDPRMIKLIRATQPEGDLLGVPQWIKLPGLPSIVEQARKRRGHNYSQSITERETKLTSSSLDTAYVIYDDLPADMKQKRVAARVGHFSHQTCYVVDGSACTWQELVDLLDGLDAGRLRLLSDMPLPEPSARAREQRKRDKVAIRVLRLSAGPWVEHPAAVSDGVYVPLSGYDIDAEGLELATYRYVQWLIDVDIWGLSKKARKATNLEHFERLDVYCTRRHREALADPAVISEFNRQATAEALKAEPGFEIVRAIAAKHFPDLHRAIEAVLTVPDGDVTGRAMAVKDFADRKLGAMPKVKIDTKPITLLRRIIKNSPLIQLLIRTEYPERNWTKTADFFDDANQDLLSKLL